MKIKDILNRNTFSLSFEVFPPKRDGNVSGLYRTIEELLVWSPDFISVTYGAGGGTRDTTIQIASKIKNEMKVETLAHLTCVQATAADIADILRQFKRNNIENIMALRGDPPGDDKTFVTTEGGFSHANELVEFIRSEGDFSIGVAGYPEVHIEAVSAEADLDYLRKKVDAGGEFIVTQIFFENEVFYRFRDRAARRGIRVPVIPGLFPIFNAKQLPKITELSNARIPVSYYESLMGVIDRPEEAEKYGIEFTIRQSEDLLLNGVAGLHFCSMNRSAHVMSILSELPLPKRYVPGQ
ncbi:MAG: methylenetetrahydrofolate reductase [NAD(P)H] [Syntrophales bacterium]|jgi:methylenetetrahydrofolate reductase (NADPH)|nr:methylenetetrahydrofolate reductase [NAD(P)H] [Syntrophales bacterium]MCK9528521.1 methylenetetrahydrofolate reductase [NAD(P)H] [Syntrophales bacterium]MDX9922853.1 methylenetetrahydrofolate reductase [NAD(P)H] [Syntrophales bacterium]